MAARTRERVVDSAGQERVQTKPPRADVLIYGGRWVTILVRRTHDVATARDLAERRLADIAVLVPHGAVLGRHRVGWWATVPTSEHRPPWPGEALDHQQPPRIVTPCLDTRHGAGPGVEFLIEPPAAAS